MLIYEAPGLSFIEKNLNTYCICPVDIYFQLFCIKFSSSLVQFITDSAPTFDTGLIWNVGKVTEGVLLENDSVNTAFVMKNVNILV